MEIKVINARKKLALLWFSLSMVIFLIFLIQTSMGKFDNKVNEGWGWILPNILPTLTLIITTFISDVRETETSSTDVFYFRISYYISLVYFLAILLIIFLYPYSNSEYLTYLMKFNIPLASFQGLVTGAIGLFFYKSK